MAMQLAALDILTTKGRCTPEMARAIGEAVDLQIESSRAGLATSQQLADTRQQLTEMTHALRSEIAASAARLELKLEQSKAEIVRWVFVVTIGQLGAMAAIVRWLGPHGF